MELGEREFEQIGEYVKTHLGQWISESGTNTGERRPPASNAEEALDLRNRELYLVERVVRVEDELKNLREVMEERFGRMDERFGKMDERFEAQRELMDERFDHIEKRTSFTQWLIGISFTAVGLLIAGLNFLG